MDYMVHVTQGSEYVVDSNFHDETGSRTLAEIFTSREMPGEVRFINSIPEMGHRQELTMTHQEKLTVPFMVMLHDFMTDGSSINRFFGTGTDDSARKAELFGRIWGIILRKTLNRESYILPESEHSHKYAAFFGQYGIDEEKCIFGECHGVPYFSVGIPHSVMLRHYPDPQAYSPCLEGLQQYFDLKLLDEDEMIEYVIPLYYMDFALWEKSALEDRTVMDLYSGCWMQTLFGALD